VWLRLKLPAEPKSVVELTLYPHSQSPCKAVAEAHVRVSCPQPHLLLIEYLLQGTIAELKIPIESAALRRDELWKHTCAEAFVASADEAGYCEFNFSPSSEWAAYRFDGYRHGMHALPLTTPHVSQQCTAETFVMRVELQLPTHLHEAQSLNLGLTMVIEAADGSLSYWALAHAALQPDFHRRESFVLAL